jgi:TonB-linked SusC/RagA family outer membrane protein
MRKLKLLLLAAFLLPVQFLWAQPREVTGKVIDEKGNPIAGVTIQEKNSRNGTSTDANGMFRLSVRPRATLVISSVGYDRKEIALTGDMQTVSVSLITATTSISEVVVTAMGVRREKKALGYAVSTIDKAKIDQRPEGDVVRILNGKVPGVDIGATSGISGSGTNILIRGLSTINGNSTPLFVVDNVPFDASTNAQSGFVQGNQTSSRFLDIDPNNIETISVLKGLAATTLYGERGRNGVILITTKNAAARTSLKKTEITVTQSLYSSTVANLPDWQNTYGGGFHQSEGFAFFSNWGAAFANPPHMLNHPYSRPGSAALSLRYQSSFPDLQGKQIPFQAAPDNVKDFFRTGWVNTSSINIAGSPSRDISLSATYTYFNDKGFIPGNNLRKHNFGFGGNAKLSNRFTLNSSINFAFTDYQTPPNSVSFGSGPSGNAPGIFSDVMYTPRSVDLMNWPFEFNDGGSAYYRGSNDIQNPRWTAKYVKFRESIQRTFGQMSLGYEILPGLNLLYRIGLDNYSNENTLQSPKGGVQFPTGVYRTVDERSTTWNHNLIGSYSHRFNSDFDISSSFGADFYINNYTQSGIYSENQLVFNVWNHSNFINHSNRGEGGGNLNYTSDVQQKGVFAEATGGYRNFLYVTAGGRNSWNSTLEKDNNHQFYPSASISIIPTSVIDALKGNKWINFAKIRFGYGTSARFPEAPYTTRSSLQINSAVFATRAGTIINTNTIPNLLPNKNLKPELLREVELGLEGRFIDNRVNLDITLYKRKSTDQILFRDLDPSTGYTTEQINGGDVENKGIEIAAGINIIRGKNANWGIEGTFTINRNKVTSLPEGIEKINVAGYTDLGGFAVVGEPLGIIEGYYVQRYPAPNDPTKPGTGQLVVDGVGNYLSSTEIGIIGNPNPKFKTSVTNNVSYKGISFRMQWDYTHRGDIYSNTIRTLYARGLTKDTEMDRLRGYILPGVKEDGTPNDIINDATNIYFNSIGFGPYDRSIFDATVIRLREVSLSYALPSKLLSKTPFGGVSITLSGQNLWFNAPNTPKYMNFDPEVSGLGAGSYRGFDFLNGPSSRRYGGSIRVTF